MSRNTLSDIATRHQVFLEGLKTQEAVGFAAVFDKLNKSTREILTGLDVENMGSLSKTKLATVISDIRKLNLAHLSKAQKSLFANLEKLAEYEAGFEVRTFAQIAPSAVLKVPDVGVAYLSALARPLSVNGSMLSGFIASWSNAEIERVSGAVRRAWAEGWPVNRLTTSVNGTKALNYADGILGAPGSSASVARRNARSIVRTAVQHVASSARMTTWEANPQAVKGYRFVATLDSRTTQICRTLDGQVYQLRSGPVPPMHINCRSTTVAQTDPALDFLDEGATRSSQTGYVDAKETYYDWLKQQPNKFQDAAIGKARGQLFRDGGLSTDQFARLNLGRNFQPLNLAQMQKLEPLAFEKAGLN